MGYLEIWALTRYLMILMSYHYFLGVRMALSFRALNISDEMICCPRTGLHNNTEGESEWVQRSVVLQVCFLTSSIGSTWELENANSQVPPQTYWIRLLGGPSNLWFNKPPRWFWCPLKSESHSFPWNKIHHEFVIVEVEVEPGGHRYAWSLL